MLTFRVLASLTEEQNDNSMMYAKFGERTGYRGAQSSQLTTIIEKKKASWSDI